MFRGVVYSRRWIYNGKKRKAWGVRYSLNGKVVRKVVADTKEGAQALLDKLKEDYRHRGASRPYPARRVELLTC